MNGVRPGKRKGAVTNQMLDRRIVAPAARPQHDPALPRVLQESDGRRPWAPWKIAAFVGVPLLVAATAFGTWWAVDRIQDDLAVSTERALESAGIDPTRLDIDVDYRDVSISGSLAPGIEPSDVAAALDLELLDDLDLDGLVAAPAPTPEPTPEPTAGPTAAPSPTPTPTPTPEPTPAPTSAATDVTVRLDGGLLTITGTVLTQTQHDALVTIAGMALGVDNIVDELEIVDLPPATPGADDRVAALRQFIGAMAGAQSGTAVLSDTDLAVAVTVADQITGNLFIGLAGITTAVPTTLDLTVAETGTA